MSEDLVGNILARLAPQELVQAQLVCKEWKRLVRAQRTRQGEPWLLFARTLRNNIVLNLGPSSTMFQGTGPQRWDPERWDILAGELPHCVAYDPAGSGNRLFIVELPESMPRRHIYFCGVTPGSGLVAFMEQLQHQNWGEQLEDLKVLAMVSRESDSGELPMDPSLFDNLWIGNPLQGSWRRVPCVRAHMSSPNVVLGRAGTGTFKVVQHLRLNKPVRGPVESGWAIRVFDSVSGRWTEGAPIWTPVPRGHLYCEDSCIGDADRGLLHYLKAGIDIDRGQLPVAQVLSYNVEKDEWSNVAAPAPLSHPRGRPWTSVGSMRVFEHQGQVKVLAAIPGPDSGQRLSLCLFGFFGYDAGSGWDWDTESELWLRDHFLDAEVHDIEQTHARGGGGHVQILCSRKWGEVFHHGMDLLQYEASSKRWSLHRNVSYPVYPRQDSTCLHFWGDSFVAFHPRLDSGPVL